jgi:CBS domain-containing protein
MNGSLEEQPMIIREVMTPNPRCVSSSDSIQNAACIMRDEDAGAVPVVDNGRAIGIVTDRDIVVRVVAEGGQLNRPIRDIVTGSLVSATPDMSTREAAQLMSDHQIRRLPVVENDRLVGIVSIGDLAVKEGKDGRIGDTLQHISEGVKERE